MSLQDEVTTSIKPGDDFYAYVNKKWIDAHPIPDNKSRLATFTVLSDENIERLKTLLETKSKKTAQKQNIERLKSFYASGMDKAQIAKTGIKPLKQRLAAISNINSVEVLQEFITQQHRNGMGMVWDLSISPDDKNSKYHVPWMVQSALGMPDRDYYLDKAKRFVVIRKKYKQFLTDLFMLLGLEQPRKKALAVFGLELKLAKAAASATKKRDAEAMYNPFSIEKWSKKLPGFDWHTYFKNIGLGDVKKVVVSEPKFMTEAIRLMNSTPISTWKSYVTVFFMLPLMDKLPAKYEKLHFDFYNRTMQGAKKPEPRYRRMINLCLKSLKEPTGQLYVEAYFKPSAKREIHNLVGHIQQALRERLETLSWMTPGTKKRAFKKLESFFPMLGYPDKWYDYSELNTSKLFVENYMSVKAFEWQRALGRLKKPVDRTEWLMSPALVNAYYWSSTNVIVFPAGILQPPFFDAFGDFAANYGAIGAVIGHEITHGFDDQGSKFDHEGNLKSWWTKQDREAFEKRAEKLEKQFDAYTVDGKQVNGKLTLGENIADLGGVLIAYDAMQKKIAEIGKRDLIDGFTPEQRFFMAWARGWRGNIRQELALQFLVTDPHSPNHLRANGVVTNCDAFYEVFDVKPGERLYRPPPKRVYIW